MMLFASALVDMGRKGCGVVYLQPKSRMPTTAPLRS